MHADHEPEVEDVDGINNKNSKKLEKEQKKSAKKFNYKWITKFYLIKKVLNVTK